MKKFKKWENSREKKERKKITSYMSYYNKDQGGIVQPFI